MAELTLTDLPTTTWTNWVGNQAFTPGFAAAPRDEQEVAALVRQAADRGAGVRVVGAGHSFTPVVQTDGLLLDLAALRGVVSTDPGASARGTRGDSDPRLLRAAVVGRAGAAQPGRHRHPADRRRRRDRHARLGHPQHEPGRRGPRRAAGDRAGDVREIGEDEPALCAPPRSRSGCSA